MNLKAFLPTAAVAVMLVGAASCEQRPKTLDQVDNPDGTDSLAYFFGQIQADDFWRQAENDTALRTETDRAEFLKGVEAGMRAAKGDDAYNKGLFLGVQLAMNCRDFEDNYNIDVDTELVLGGLRKGLENDSAIDIAEAHSAFYRVVDRLNDDKESRDTMLAMQALKKAALARGMVKVADNLYAVDVTAGKGALLKEGDRVTLGITAATTTGRMAGGHFPTVTTLGEGRLPDVIRQAIYTMTPDQTRQFMTTPMAIFGRRYVRMDLCPGEPIVFTVNARMAEAAPADSI